MSFARHLLLVIGSFLLGFFLAGSMGLFAFGIYDACSNMADPAGSSKPPIGNPIGVWAAGVVSMMILCSFALIGGFTGGLAGAKISSSSKWAPPTDHLLIRGLALGQLLLAITIIAITGWSLANSFDILFQCAIPFVGIGLLGLISAWLLRKSENRTEFKLSTSSVLIIVFTSILGSLLSFDIGAGLLVFLAGILLILVAVRLWLGRLPD